MKKGILALLAIHAALFALHASVPLRWTVETSRAQSAQFEAFRGETVDLEATMQSYGMPLEVHVQPSLYWQTNGMGAAWWTAPASCSGNVVRASFTPANDCGANAYNCFIGGTGSTYRATFRLRMLPSPGFTPNVLPLPSVTYDAALFGEPTINGTNLTEWVSARSQAESDPVFSEWVRTNEFSSAGGSVAGVDTNAVNALIVSATNAITETSIGGPFVKASGETMVYGTIKLDDVGGVVASAGGYVEIGDAGVLIIDEGSWIYDYRSDPFALRSEVSSVASSVSTISNTVSAIASAPTTYTNVTGNAYVALNQSVQTITVNGTAITLGEMPTPVPGGTRDFIIYVNNTSATTDAPLSLPAGTYYGDDGSTNAFAKGTISAMYLTEMNNGVFMIGRRELKQIVIQ